VVAHEEDAVRIAGLEDRCDLFVSRLVDGIDVAFLAAELVEDRVRLLELDEPEVRVELVGEIANASPRIRTRFRYSSIFASSESESSSRV